MSCALEVERIVSDWLMTDVNTRMASVPVDTGDPTPPLIASFTSADYPTTTRAVFDSTRHAFATEGKEPPTYPALYVNVQGVVRMKGAPVPTNQYRESSKPVAVAIKYIAPRSQDAATSKRDGRYTMRAVARSLRELELDVNGASRLRNGVLIVLSEDDFEFYPVVGTLGNALIAGAIVVHYYVRDGNPSF